MKPVRDAGSHNQQGKSGKGQRSASLRRLLCSHALEQSSASLRRLLCSHLLYPPSTELRLALEVVRIFAAGKNARFAGGTTSRTEAAMLARTLSSVHFSTSLSTVCGKPRRKNPNIYPRPPVRTQNLRLLPTPRQFSTTLSTAAHFPTLPPFPVSIVRFLCRTKAPFSP